MYIFRIKLPGKAFAQTEYSLGLTYNKAVSPNHLSLRRQMELYYVSWYIRQGSAELESAGAAYHAGPGQWVFMDPLCEHSHRLAEKTELVSIRFRIFWRGLDFLPPLAPIRIVEGRDWPDLLPAAEALCAANESEHAPASPKFFHRQARFYDWLAAWRRERESLGLTTEAPEDPRVYEIMAHLSQSISIAPIDYSALQRAVGLSRAQIDRVFQKALGLTPRQWMVARCLDEAQRQIRYGDRSLKEIALSLGFFDASHFTRWHRRQTGQSPTDWRAQQAL